MNEIANTECYATWNGESGVRWAEEADRRDRVLAPVADALLDAARLSPAETVVDIGCGCGVTSVAAARAVGPRGAVCSIDLSAPMLDVARSRCATAGFDNVAFVQGDAQTQAFGSVFDVAISRFGTMFFAEPVVAFANVAGALRAGGRLCLATWQPLARNDWLTVPGAALLRYGRLPDTAAGGPGMFGQSDPDVIVATLRAAGFANVECDPVTVTFELGRDVEDATDYLARSGIGRAVLDSVPAARQPEALDAVRAVLAEFTDRGAVRLDGAVWIVGAERAA